MLSHLQRLYVVLIAPRRDDRGATATEYALLVGLVAFIIIGGVTLFGQNLLNFFTGIGEWVGEWAPGGGA